MSEFTLADIALEEAEIKETQDTIEDLQDSSSDAQDDLETLQGINGVLKDKQETIDPTAQKIAQIATEALCKRLGVAVPKSISTENYSGFSTQAQVRIAIEENEGVIARIIEALKAVLKKIVDFFKKLFTQIKNFIHKLLGKDNLDEKAIEEIAKKNEVTIKDATTILETQENGTVTLGDTNSVFQQGKQGKVEVTPEMREKAERLVEKSKNGITIDVDRELLLTFMSSLGSMKTWQNKTKVSLKELVDFTADTSRLRDGYLDNFFRDMERHLKRIETIKEITEQEVKEYSENIYGSLVNALGGLKDSSRDDMLFMPLNENCSRMNILFAKIDNLPYFFAVAPLYNPKQRDEFIAPGPVKVDIEFTVRDIKNLYPLRNAIRKLGNTVGDNDASIQKIITRFEKSIESLEKQIAANMRANSQNNLKIQKEYMRFLSSTIKMVTFICQASTKADKDVIVASSKLYEKLYGNIKLA